ncbi:hypothetical protein C2S53_002753 [Perilla frutescens var. hirtella]|uniref:Uncharacterized protein n=1 Tax=Perilla frutescens var. hirtella TaxID=608512 RepID=A0AAD4J0P0_PERFH|nr:hypothetical protein C2S53_002753 [Perilla frutescens var. hirtella]
MALSYLQVFIAILVVLLPIAAKGDDFPPGLAPYYDEICKEVECGKGSCEASSNIFPFSFKCNCEQGWKRTRLDTDEGLEFLPCIIPNCSVDYSCMPAPPPMPAVPHNLSVFDPCYWVYCGEGTCTKNRTRTHTCQCDSGRTNLFNISAFPCYSDCAIGSDSCESLGLKVSSSTANPSPNGDSNQAITFSIGKFNWMAVLLAAAAVAFWK